MKGYTALEARGCDCKQSRPIDNRRAAILSRVEDLPDIGQEKPRRSGGVSQLAIFVGGESHQHPKYRMYGATSKSQQFSDHVKPVARRYCLYEYFFWRWINHWMPKHTSAAPNRGDF
jgi:hypothetical protein